MNAMFFVLVTCFSVPGDGLPVPDDGKWGMSLRAESWTEMPTTTPEERRIKEQARKAWTRKLREEEAFFLRNARKQRLFSRYLPIPVIEVHTGHPTR